MSKSIYQDLENAVLNNIGYEGQSYLDTIHEITSRVFSSGDKKAIERVKSILKMRYQVITVPQLLQKLMQRPMGETIDFTFTTSVDEECEGWYGVKTIAPFDEPENCILMGEYGVYSTIIRCITEDIGIESIEETFEEMLCEILELDDPCDIPPRVCVDRLYNGR